jgi:septum formation protein
LKRPAKKAIFNAVIMEHIILASGSPRRQDFFRLLGLPFTSVPADIDETPQQGLNPDQVAEDLAQKKALAVAEKLPPSASPWIFAADTIVVLDGKLFGKPDNREAAKQMLNSLSGKWHDVITAIALFNRNTAKMDCRSVSCAVEFAPLSAAEIEWYLETGEWQGAAGAYRLQEIGACLVRSIRGSPSTVAGLPLHDFYVMLKDNGYQFGA